MIGEHGTKKRASEAPANTVFYSLRGTGKRLDDYHAASCVPTDHQQIGGDGLAFMRVDWLVEQLLS